MLGSRPEVFNWKGQKLKREVVGEGRKGVGGGGVAAFWETGGEVFSRNEDSPPPLPIHRLVLPCLLITFS